MKRLPSLLLLASLSCGAPAQQPPPPEKFRATYRALAGVSMGAIGGAALTFQRPGELDAAALLGGPLDTALLLRSMERFQLGGFCPLAELEVLAAQGKLNDRAAVDACSRRPASLPIEHSQDFNHWVPTTNGGNFNRNMYLDIFEDLSLAYGNMLYENPASPFAPPGVDPERLRRPPADFCTNPVRVTGLFNAEFNPDGKHDAITFCDGQPRLWFCRATMELVDFCSDPQNVANPIAQSQEATFAQGFCAAKGGAQEASVQEQPLLTLNHWGQVNPCVRPSKPFKVALAVDLNGNGRRDYGEPLINNGAERFDDVGADGCGDEREDGQGGCGAAAASGDPNGDDYDAELNPLGTEGNWSRDEGEPFRDHGLDGVPGTADPGEGNGAFDQSSGRRRAFAADPRLAYRRMEAPARGLLSLYFDGGRRDVFNLGLMSKQLFGLVAHLNPGETGAYRAFEELPGMVDRSGDFNPFAGNWRAPPRHLLVLYGKEQPTDQERMNGDGDHVGDASQAVNRFGAMFGWVGAQWPSLPRPPTSGGSDYARRVLTDQWFDSAALGARRDYAVYLPPGYDTPGNEAARYPVLYVLHGYGMDPSGMSGTALFADPNMKQASGGRLRPMLMVFPNGRCCLRNTTTGARDCRERDDLGRDLDQQPGWSRECRSGSFFVDGVGYTNGGGLRYGEALFELMREVDAKYRTLPPADVEAR